MLSAINDETRPGWHRDGLQNFSKVNVHAFYSFTPRG
jgi:hypothetical protein